VFWAIDVEGRYRASHRVMRGPRRAVRRREIVAHRHRRGRRRCRQHAHADRRASIAAVDEVATLTAVAALARA
jgi:hypothetical protein